MAITLSNIKENVVASPMASGAPTMADVTMKNAFIASGVLHVGILVVSLIGIPFLAKPPPLIITPVSIELVDISDVTQTDRVAEPIKEDKPKDIEKPEPPKAAPKMTAPTPPDLTQPEPEEIEKPKEVEEPPKPEPILEVPKEEKPKPIEKPKPKPKPKPKEKPKPKPKQEDLFDSLLKNLAPDAEEQQEEKPKEKEEDTASGNIAKLADQLSISELDAFKYQLEPCWNVPAGAKYAEDLAVEIRVSMARDGTVNKASVLNTGRYNRDSSFRAAADSALRSLRNPRCSPLKLPPEKYDQWKSIVINFDPQSML